ncbi:MAG: type II toxin-antitoxin system RelB/DinJ family antitoxin [Candidatus Paracaedibacteraceae bacterium]|nr:type II toxin-antitoxin system RelB/DinJ family antitoxin [Candidatus Paracaedibacteraceae bacterium]
MRTETVRTRVDPEVKQRATLLFRKLGLTMSDALNLFLHQSICEERIPFDIKLPNAETLEAIKAAQRVDVKETSREEIRKIWDEAKEDRSDQ